MDQTAQPPQFILSRWFTETSFFIFFQKHHKFKREKKHVFTIKLFTISYITFQLIVLIFWIHGNTKLILLLRYGNGDYSQIFFFLLFFNVIFSSSTTSILHSEFNIYILFFLLHNLKLPYYIGVAELQCFRISIELW